MDNEDVAFHKMALLLNAATGDKQMVALDELKAAVFEVILLHPGCKQDEWAQILVEQYGTEVIDAFGNNHSEIYSGLADLWGSPYLDKNSGIEYAFSSWARALCNEAAVDMYYTFIKEWINE